jgi:hypothetical protein
MEVYVFSDNQWQSILTPPDTEHWSQADRQLYGSLVVHYEKKGIRKVVAEQLAESFVFTKQYHGLRYQSSWEKSMRHLLETT